MAHYKISRLLNDSIVSKFVAKKWIEVNNSLGGQYSTNKNIRGKSPMLRSDLCDYSDAYIVVKGTIDFLAAAANKNHQEEKQDAFKNNVRFRPCMSKLTAN